MHEAMIKAVEQEHRPISLIELLKADGDSSTSQELSLCIEIGEKEPLYCETSPQKSSSRLGKSWGTTLLQYPLLGPCSGSLCSSVPRHMSEARMDFAQFVERVQEAWTVQDRQNSFFFLLQKKERQQSQERWKKVGTQPLYIRGRCHTASKSTIEQSD